MCRRWYWHLLPGAQNSRFWRPTVNGRIEFSLSYSHMKVIKFTLRGFCIVKHNWRLIDTVCGAKFSAVIYSITEAAYANVLKVYDYVEHLMTEILKHEDDIYLSFLDDPLHGHRISRSIAESPINMK